MVYSNPQSAAYLGPFLARKLSYWQAQAGILSHPALGLT